MSKLPFIPDQVYNRRRDIHVRYGGNWQSGISPSASYPFIFIFSGEAGLQHGYKDGWVNTNVYEYTGEGQVGDMEFSKGNLALRDHYKNGKRVFLFKILGGGLVRFINEFVYFDADYFETHDRNNEERQAIKFFLMRIGSRIPIKTDLPGYSQVKEPQVEIVSVYPNETERKGLVTSRVGQGAYRKSIIHRWEYRCAVTRFDKLNVLIASHILPWAIANDSQRLDVHNGILLSPTYDALFDKKLISFENNGKIILSPKIETEAFTKIGVSGKERIRNFSEYNFEYLDKHREGLFHNGTKNINS